MIRIVTDSTSEITLEQMKELNIDVVPLAVRFGEETYTTLYEITNEEFYEKMKNSSEMPNTMQVNPYQFEEVFEKYLENGDEIITIMLGAKLSGTCQSAIIAKNSLESDKITVIDTKNLSVAIALLVEIAIRMRDQGRTASEIVETLESYISKTKMYFIPDNLDFLKHGGRISADEAIAGEKLGMRPIIEAAGTLSVIDKVKGKKAANRFLLKRLENYGIEENTPISIGHANAPELAEDFVRVLRDNGYDNEIIIHCIGPVIGSHMGANTLGLAFIAKKAE